MTNVKVSKVKATSTTLTQNVSFVMGITICKKNLEKVMISEYSSDVTLCLISKRKDHKRLFSGVGRAVRKWGKNETQLNELLQALTELQLIVGCKESIKLDKFWKWSLNIAKYQGIEKNDFC